MGCTNDFKGVRLSFVIAFTGSIGILLTCSVHPSEVIQLFYSSTFIFGSHSRDKMVVAVEGR